MSSIHYNPEAEFDAPPTYCECNAELETADELSEGMCDACQEEEWKAYEREREFTQRQWRAWRDDYRCARPEAVTCKGCNTTYEPTVDPPVSIYKGYTLIECSNC